MAHHPLFPASDNFRAWALATTRRIEKDYEALRSLIAATDSPLVIMTEDGVLTGPSVIVTGGTSFAMLGTINIQSVENESSSQITVSPPAGYTFRSGGNGDIAAGDRAVFQLVPSVNQVKRIV